MIKAESKKIIPKSLLSQTAINVFLFIFSWVFVQDAVAVGANLATIITNLAATMPSLTRLVTAIGYVVGMFFVAKGVLELKHMGETRTQMSREHSITAPTIYILVGGALLYLPSAVEAGLTTFWTNPAPYDYQTDSEDPWSELTTACFMIIQLIGIIAFIRGLIMLTTASSGHGQSSFGKALSHIIGGILCIDIYDFVTTIWNTLALGQL